MVTRLPPCSFSKLNGVPSSIVYRLDLKFRSTITRSFVRLVTLRTRTEMGYSFHLLRFVQFQLITLEQSTKVYGKVVSRVRELTEGPRCGDFRVIYTPTTGSSS